MRQGSLLPAVFVLSTVLVLGPESAFAADPPPSAPRRQTLEAVLDKIAKSYVEPSRVDPRKMLWAAARALDRDIPEVLLEASPDPDTLSLRVAGARKAFPAGGVRSLRALEKTLGEILRFVSEGRAPSSKPNAEYAAINGMLATLDPHSLLLNPAEAREFSSTLAAGFSGIGIVFDISGGIGPWATPGPLASGSNPGEPVVMRVMKGGPAEEAGIAICDRILAVEGRWATGLDWEELVGALRGPTGSPVWITLLRDGALRDMVLTRGQIKIPSVSSRRLDGDVGLIRIDGFVSGTAAEVRSAIAEMKKAGASAWILDLRANPGGLLSQAIETASIFLRSGPIVTEIGEAGRNREVKSAKQEGRGLVEGGPLVILIGPSTASAAEVLTSALQNRNRAAVLGRTSFGKGSVQVLFNQEDGSRLKLTIAHYLTPGGASLQSRGVVPDIELVPVGVPRQGRIRVVSPETPWREADLDRSFAPREAPRPSGISLRYLAATPDGEEEVLLSRELVAGTRLDSRGQTLVRGASILNGKRALEETRIGTALEDAGVDWSAGQPKAPPALSARCVQGGPVVRDRVPVTCEVRNDGPNDAERVYGRSPFNAFDFRDEEIVVGRVPAGASRKVSVEGNLAEDPSPRVSWVPLTFSEQRGATAGNTPLRIEVPRRTRPTESAGAGGHRLTIVVEAPLESTQETLRVRADARDPSGVLDAWVRMSNDSAKVDRKKVAYLSPPPGASLDRLEIAADVPLRPGLNEIGVCARGKDEERCEAAFVYRVTETPP